MKSIKFYISNFNQYLILIICTLFLYLFYLSIPSLYDKSKLQKSITDKILKDFKINVSISPEITYSILPKPHILFENVKIFNDDNLQEVSQIKKLKIFISQKNLFNQKKLKINHILIQEANFFLNQKNINFYNNFINQKFSKKIINIKNSKFFYNDFKNEVISIISISNLSIFQNSKKSNNQIIVNGESFNIPFNFSWQKNFSHEDERTSLLKLNKINLHIKNISKIENKKKIGINNLNLMNLKINSNYEIYKNFLAFESNASTINNSQTKYKGKIYSDPFEILLDIETETINLNDVLDYKFIFEELLKTKLLFNENLTLKISFNSKKILNNKLFDKLIIYLNMKDGKINFDNSNFESNQIGSLKLFESKVNFANNEIVFFGKMKFDIIEQIQFYKVFQIPKKNRKEIKNLFFEIRYNFFKDELKINNIQLNKNLNNDLKVKNEIIIDNDKETNTINNWIDLKRFTNKLIKNYDG